MIGNRLGSGVEGLLGQRIVALRDAEIERIQHDQLGVPAGHSPGPERTAGNPRREIEVMVISEFADLTDALLRLDPSRPELRRVKLLQIVWVDIILAGDNAVVIAMACRALPDKTRKWGIILGALVAIVLRVIFAGIITTLLAIWGLKIAGGLALIYIAVELLLPQKHEGENAIAASDTLFRAIRTIAIADLVTLERITHRLLTDYFATSQRA